MIMDGKKFENQYLCTLSKLPVSGKQSAFAV